MDIKKIDRTKLAPPEEPAAPEQPAIPAETPEQDAAAPPPLVDGASAKTSLSPPSDSARPTGPRRAAATHPFVRQRWMAPALLIGLLVLVVGLVFWDSARLIRWRRAPEPVTLGPAEAAVVFDITCSKLKEYRRVNGAYPPSLGSVDPAWTYTLRLDGTIRISLRAAGRVFRFDSAVPADIRRDGPR